MPAEEGEKTVILEFKCHGHTRHLEKLDNAVVAVRQDSSVDVIRMSFDPAEFNNITLGSVAVKFLYVDETAVVKAYSTGTELDSGVYWSDWEITDDVVDAEGNITFAVKLAIIDDGVITQEWFSRPQTFKVYDTLTDSNTPAGETSSEQATNAEKIAALESELATTNSNLASEVSRIEGLIAKCITFQ